MSAIGTSDLDSDPALQRLLVDQHRRESSRWLDRHGRERAIELGSAACFLITAGAMVALLGSSRSFDPWLTAGLLFAYTLAARVEFDTGSGFTRPTELVLVPMLFLIPLPAVPLVVAAGVVLARAPRILRGEIRPAGAIVSISDAWHAVGPALVLIAADATVPEWSAWPVYVAALAAQFAFDLASTIVRVGIGLRIATRTLLLELRVIYLVDALLAPIGLLAAFASAQWQWAFLLVLPLIGLIRFFAREREARIENALTLSSAYRGTALLLGEVLSYNHEYTGSHSRSVVLLAHHVGESLGLDEATMREVEFGALLHDVGKMAVPNEIINKPGRLTDEEMELMRTHTLEGERMLGRIGGVLADVGEVVRSHHEFFDGGGYPDGLRGEEIPVASRVISCCDAFNAMTTDRPYRGAMSVGEAITELRAHSGTQFDPVVVDAVIEIVDTWGEPIPADAGDAVAATIGD